MARFFAPLLAYHDRRKFSVYCYAHVVSPDAVTEKLRMRADHWRDIVAMNDEEAAELIRRDGIDILVDLCGHMPGNRLKLFALRPAPVQVSYLAYPATTGTRAMDWRIVDADVDPPGQTDRFHTERLARIEGGCWCYHPDLEGPAVNGLPVLTGQPFTFAMLNRLVKVTPGMIRLWAQIVEAVPHSRLMVLATGSGRLQRSTLDLFRRQGFPLHKLMPVPRQSRDGYLRLFQQADLVLDTFPYAGQTTTCDALWMGVPTVTLAGRTHVTRAGLAIMRAVRLEEFVAHSPDEYVNVAVKAASDLPRLQQLRGSLRRRMAQSPLCDPNRLTRGIEAAFEEMWGSRLAI